MLIRLVLMYLTKHSWRKVILTSFDHFIAFLFRPMDQVPAVLRALTEDHIRMYELLQASDRDWIAVCPPHIAGKKAF